MTRIRLAMLANDMNINGISTVMMNYSKALNMTKFDVTIIAGTPIAPVYQWECDAAGIRILALPERKTDSRNYYTALWSVLDDNFDMVHVHGNSATISIELLLACLRNIKIRVAHCHNNTCNRPKLHKLLLPLFYALYTHGFACSERAGRWLFGEKDFYVIPNGFDTRRFEFHSDIREQVRAKYEWSDKYVIGHIGRFNNQKNHPFLLQVFCLVAEECPEALLLLIGTGPDLEQISELIARHKFRERIILYGESECTERLYPAMDVFVLPSKHEGLGIVLLEAQMNGLPCVASDVIPQETYISDNIQVLSLEESMAVWCRAILRKCNITREAFFDECQEQITHYDITTNARRLERLYETFYEENQVQVRKGRIWRK